MPDDATAIGHNRPTMPTPETVRGLLSEDHAPLVERVAAIKEAAARVPEMIGDEDTARRAADFVGQVNACEKKRKAAFEDEKRPWIDGGRAVDGFFKALADDLDGVKKGVNVRLTAYQRAKADAERKAREEAERKAREEAERIAKEAAAIAAEMDSEEALARAIEAEEQARAAAASAARAATERDAGAADLSRTRGEYGTVASLRKTWTFEVEDLSAIALDPLRPYLPQTAIEQAIRGFIRAGGRELPGVRIFEDFTTVTR